MRYGRAYERWVVRPGYDRPYRRRRPSGYAAEYVNREAYGEYPARGWASSYPGPFSRGLPGAGAYQRSGPAEVQNWAMAPWAHPVPGRGVGYSLPYGMGNRGQWL